MKSFADLLTMPFSETISMFYRVSQSHWTLQLSKSSSCVFCQQLLRFQVFALTLVLCFKETKIRAQNAEARFEGLVEKQEEALQGIKSWRKTRKPSKKQQTRKGKVRITNILTLFPHLETEAIFEDTSLFCLMQNPPLLDTS